jgi:GAF domain-containing protein
VPQGYLSITSGLGEASPSSLVIIPMIANGQVEGLLELASFHLFQDHHIEFLEKAAENLAGWLATDRANARTRQLLEQTKLQAEALRAQEEEMRQNLEELMTTQEEWQLKQR